MRSIRLSIAVLALLFVPLIAFAQELSLREYLIGFHHPAAAGEKARALQTQHKLKKAMKRLPVISALLDEAEADTLRRDPRVAYVAENLWVQAIDVIPGAEYDTAWGVSHIGARQAHEAGYQGQDVRVAVLDTGIDYRHPDLSLRYAGGYDFVFDDDDPMDDSSSQHGTHAAGIIVAQLNGEGVVGVAPQARIYGVKVLDGAGFGSLEWLIEGIDWAIANEMHIINLSLAFDENSLAVQDACDRAWAAGLLLVASAGNTGGGAALYPATYESVIAVNATDKDDLLGAFSAMDTRIELAAPGMSIVSTSRNNQYISLSGTSQAAPHVAGTAALLLAADPTWSNEQIRLRLQQSAVDLGATGRDAYFGFGRVDAAAALNLDAPPTEPDLKRKVKKNKKPKLTDLKKYGLTWPE